MSDKPIYVTQPNLPPLSEMIPYLEQIWESKTITNGGPFHQRLEHALCEHLGVKHISLFVNGTIALVTALQALRLTGEVITTPYSFVATANSLLWNGLTPVFVDIDRLTLNLDPNKLEAAITPKTTAILPVHCYGHPCDIQAITLIAHRHNLKVVYDAAHAYGVRFQGQSLLNHGDLSVLSFHATKVFNTFEGGAIVSHDLETKRYIDRLRNFGFVDETTVVEAGINGKMSEFNAAFGLLQLQHVDQALERRASIAKLYIEGLKGIRGIKLLSPVAELVPNNSYFPILIEPDYPLSRDALYFLLSDKQIYGRRYFYPLISNFPMYRDMPSANVANLPVSNLVADQIICLPIYPSLSDPDIKRVVDVISSAA